MKKLLLLTLLLTQAFWAQAQTSVRECIRLSEGWKFAFGNASNPAKDFG